MKTRGGARQEQQPGTKAKALAEGAVRWNVFTWLAFPTGYEAERREDKLPLYSSTQFSSKQVRLCQPGGKTPQSLAGQGLQASALGTTGWQKMLSRSGPAVMIGPGTNKMPVNTAVNRSDRDTLGPRHTLGHAGATMSRAFSGHFVGLGVLAWGLTMESLICGPAARGIKHAGNFTEENGAKNVNSPGFS